MKQKEKITRLIEVQEAIVGMRTDGIVHVYYKAGTEITIELQDKMLQIFNDITGNKKCPFIFQAAEGCTVNREARDNAIAMEHKTPLKATVVFVSNLAHKMISEFYYKFNKPRQPYKVSTDFEEGIEWLLQVDRETEAAY
jgi:hypothetical protein